MRALLIGFSLLLTGCFYSLAGLDMSAEGRHKMWLESMQKTVGRNIFNCNEEGRCHQYRGNGSLFQGDTPLNNGNYEANYFGSRTKKCRYFLEYEPSSGLIVNFRFEKSEPFACRISGA